MTPEVHYIRWTHPGTGKHVHWTVFTSIEDAARVLPELVAFGAVLLDPPIMTAEHKRNASWRQQDGGWVAETARG